MFSWQWTSTGLVYPQASSSVTFMRPELSTFTSLSHIEYSSHFLCGPGRNHNPGGNAIHEILMLMLQMLGQWVHWSQLRGNLCGRTPWSSGPNCTDFQFSPGCFPPTEDWKHRLEVCLVEELLKFINSGKKKELASWQWERKLKRMKTQHRNQ